MLLSRLTPDELIKELTILGIVVVVCLFISFLLSILVPALCVYFKNAWRDLINELKAVKR